MENDESPTKIPPLNQSNSAGRNVLKELNNLDGIANSSKPLSSRDQLVSPKESFKNLSDIITNVQSVVRKDEDFVASKPLQVISSRRSINNSTNDDDLFVERNSTFKTDSNQAEVNSTIDNVSAILDETIHMLKQLGFKDNVSQNANQTVSCGENLNNAFINVTDSSVGSLEANKQASPTSGLNTDNKTQDQVAAVQNQAEDIQQLTVSKASIDSTVSASLTGGAEITIQNHNSTDANSQSVQNSRREYESLAVVEDSRVESTKLAETVIVATGAVVENSKAESNKLNDAVGVITGAIDEDSKVESNKLDKTVVVATDAVVENSKVESNELNDTVVVTNGAADDNFKVESNELAGTVVVATGAIDEEYEVESNKSNETVVVATCAAVENSKLESNNLDEIVVVATATEVKDSKVESNKLNETVVAAEHQQETASTPITEVKSGAFAFIACEASSSAGSSNEQAVTIINEAQDDVSVATHLNATLNVETSQNLSNAGVKLRNLNETKRPEESNEDGACHQESTSIVTNMPSDRTSVLGSTNLGQETEIFVNNVNQSKNAEFPKLKPIEKIREFQTNQTISVDSLDATTETRDCSLDSIEIKQSLQHQPISHNEKIVKNGMSDEILEEKNSSVVSKTLATELVMNDKQSIVDHLLPKDTPKPAMLDSDEPVVSQNCNNRNQSDFKTPMLRNSTFTKMKNLQSAGGDSSDLMVLNSNDFDFLISRGGICVDPEEDRRNSILLRFDPLLKNRPSVTPFTPAVQIVEESVQGEQCLVDIKSIVEETHSNTSGENSVDEQKLVPAKPPSTNEAAMSVGLVHNSNSMDNEAKAYVNNIKTDRTEEKHIQIDGVPLNDKKTKFVYTDENIQKRMEEYEATQEILLKRLSEKDKAIGKTSNVLELYEKAIAEVLAAKEKLAQTYEKTHEELKTDRDLNFQHLLSLESTFSDLHMKYERNVQYITQLQEKLNALAEEKAKSEESLTQQETRYDKLTGHALQQFDIANSKWEQQSKSFSAESTKLRAQIKREEIYKNAVHEELLQKRKENEELVKICDELISGQKS